ncbi:MAG: hypothetical protein ACR2OB_10770 [Solirubrobacteraceae bacterium]
MSTNRLPGNALQPRDLAALSAGESLRTPARELPLIDAAPLEPFAIDALRVLDRRVIKNVRLGPGSQQRRVVLTPITQTPVDQRRHPRQHADRLPARLTTAVQAAEATLLATALTTPKPQFATSTAPPLLHLLALSWLYPFIAQRHKRRKSYGWWVVAHQTHRMGLIDLNGTIVAPRPSRSRRQGT